MRPPRVLMPLWNDCRCHHQVECGSTTHAVPMPACLSPCTRPQISAKDSFEIAFNAACGLVEAGQLRAAEEQLQLAVRVGE